MHSNSSRMKKTMLNTIVGIVNKFGIAILNFIMRTVFIYTLGMQYTGVSSVFTDILSVLSLSELGISTAISTALYKPLHDDNRIMICKLMKFYKIAYRYIALFIMIVGLMLLPFLNFFITDVPDIKEDIRLIFIFYIIRTSISYLLVYKSTILSADQKQYIITIRELICVTVRYILEIILLFIFKSFIIYLIVEVILILIQNIIVTNKAKREYPYAFEKTNEKLSKEDKKSLLKNIKGLSMYKVSATVGNSIDNILISKFIGTAVSGIYSSYNLIRLQIELILKQFFSAVTPSIGNLIASGSVDKQYYLFNKIFYISFVVINFCSVSMFILYNTFIEMWIGEKYLLSNSISFIIAFDSYLYILLQAIASFRTANGLFIKGQYRPLIMAIMNVILSIILIQQYGIFGTVLATVICRLLTQWYDPYLLFKYIFKQSFFKFYVKYLMYMLLFAVSSIATYYISSLYSFDNIITNFVFKIICCIIIPNIIVLIFTYKTDEFKSSLNIIKKKFMKGKKA